MSAAQFIKTRSTGRLDDTIDKSLTRTAYAGGLNKVLLSSFSKNT
jgi:hypothetical protein